MVVGSCYSFAIPKGIDREVNTKAAGGKVLKRGI